MTKNPTKLILADVADYIDGLETENWQLKQALGYPIPADKETPNNPFNCGMCEARNKVDNLTEIRDSMDKINHSNFGRDETSTNKTVPMEDGLRLAASEFAVMDKPTLARMMEKAASKIEWLRIDRDRWQKKCINSDCLIDELRTELRNAKDVARDNYKIIKDRAKEIDILNRVNKKLAEDARDSNLVGDEHIRTIGMLKGVIRQNRKEIERLRADRIMAESNAELSAASRLESDHFIDKLRKENEQLRAMYNNAKGMEKHYNICYHALKDILKVRYPISNEPLVDVWTIAARALNSNLDDMVEPDKGEDND